MTLDLDLYFQGHLVKVKVNRVRSVASTVLDTFFVYLAQIITIIRGCVACYVFEESENLNFWQIF